MKTKKLYEIRLGQGLSPSIRVGMKLRPYNRSRKLVSKLKSLGYDAFAAPLIIWRGE